MTDDETTQDKAQEATTRRTGSSRPAQVTSGQFSTGQVSARFIRDSGNRPGEYPSSQLKLDMPLTLTELYICHSGVDGKLLALAYSPHPH